MSWQRRRSQLVAWAKASSWLPLVAKSIGTVSAVVALSVVGSMPLASAHVALSSAAPAIASAAPALPVAAPLVAAETQAPRDPMPDKLVVLNTATTEELQSLPGVGPKRAEAILALRTRLGRFKRVEDLLRVKGIGHASLRRLKPHVVIDPAPAPP